MKDHPKVSIILTSYNHARFIEKSIESALNQSFKDFELIIWDDASTDNSWEIISHYQDPRIKAIRNETNQRGRNIKRAIKEVVKGEYVAIHHSDDIWKLDKLEKQVDFLNRHPDIGAVFTHVQLIDEDGKPFNDITHPYYKVFDQPNRSRHEWLRYFFFHGNGLCHPSILIRHDCYKKSTYRNGLTQLPDFDMWLQLCLDYEIYVIQEKLIQFRIKQDESNTSGNRPDTRVRLQFEVLRALDHYQKIPSINDLLKIFPEANTYLNEHNQDLLYALGRVSVEKGVLKQHKLFGLNLLFDALNDSKRAKALETYHGFNKQSFIKLTARHDIFAVEETRKLTEDLENLKKGPVFYAINKIKRLKIIRKK